MGGGNELFNKLWNTALSDFKWFSSIKATSGGLNANFYTESWPLVMVLTICAEPSPGVVYFIISRKGDPWIIEPIQYKPFWFLSQCLKR